MPRPIDRPEAYLPGLDGLRALSVIAVVGYHLRVATFGGGFLGVGMFFTLSGFLITSILRREHLATGTINLRAFWLRRARRLLPGVVLLLVVVLITTAIAQPDNLATRWSEAVAAVLYISNWATIRNGISYFDRFAGPGPLDHLWSLAIEEQFYLIWPVFFGGAMRLLRNRLKLMAVLVAGLAGVSFLLLDRFAVAGFDNTRAYEGTDTRAGGMLIGAALALLWSPRSGQQSSTQRLSRGRQLALELAGVGSVGTIGWLIVTTDQYDQSLYRWRILFLSLVTALLLVAVIHPASRLGGLFGITPLRWIGERSYGIYLWHLPLASLMPDSFLADQPIVRNVIVIGLTLLLAELSWTLMEDPIRIHGFIRALRLRRYVTISHVTQLSVQTNVPILPSLATWSMTAAFGVAVLTALSLAGQTNSSRAEELIASEAKSGDIAQVAVAPTSSSPPSGVVTSSPLTSVVTTSSTPISTTVMTSLPLNTAPSLAPTTTVEPASTTTWPSLGTTSCTSVAHIGDSTSVGLMSPQFLPNAAQRIDARYQEVGVGVVRTNISGARSIVERYKGEPNAASIANSLTASGHDGCWVFAMGTNDSANSAAGSVVNATKRIDVMMQAAKGQPVMWPTVKTLINTGPYSDSSMERFNQALLDACTRYPNLRVYDWRAEVQDGWYQRDGIHFTSKGYAERARYIARALTRAFPADGQSSSCIV
jgi:peptidoglycan/LPS O-acetylase OafA/YrhL